MEPPLLFKKFYFNEFIDQYNAGGGFLKNVS